MGPGAQLLRLLSRLVVRGGVGGDNVSLRGCRLEHSLERKLLLE